MNADPAGTPVAGAGLADSSRAPRQRLGDAVVWLLRSFRTSRPGVVGRESGAALVEMAFVLTLLAMLLVGVTTAAIAFGRNNSIENSAREASRYAATLPGPVDTTWLRGVRDVARASALGELEASSPGQYICVAHYDGSAWARLTDTGGLEGPQPDSQSCFADSLPADEPRVQIVTTRDTTIDGAVFSIDVTLVGEAAARYER